MQSSRIFEPFADLPGFLSVLTETGRSKEQEIQQQVHADLVVKEEQQPERAHHQQKVGHAGRHDGSLLLVHRSGALLRH
jgi:hypothetical protein